MNESEKIYRSLPSYMWHNPDGLAVEQLGEGFRFMLKSEVGSRSSMDLSEDIWAWDDALGRLRWRSNYAGSSDCLTYRVSYNLWPFKLVPSLTGISERNVFVRSGAHESVVVLPGEEI